MSQRKAERELMKRIVNLHGTDGYVVADPIDNSLEWFPKAEFSAIPYDTPTEMAEHYVGKMKQAVKLIKDNIGDMSDEDRLSAGKCARKLEGVIKEYEKLINEKAF